jgi:hypothetical protein
MLLGKMKAPGLIKKQIPEEALNFEVNYDDFGVPKVFSIKEIKFGTGSVRATIQLDAEKIIDMAMGYRSDLMSEISRFKSSQGGMISTFISNILDTGVLEEGKIREYVQSILDNEELVNGAIHFAFVNDYSKYTNKLEEAQDKVVDWASPLKAVKMYGSIEETIEKIIDDAKLTDFLKWFLSEDQIAEYKSTILEYYGMYQDYLGMYDDLLASIDKSVAGINIKDIDDSVDSILKLATNIKDSKEVLLDTIAEIDADAFAKLIKYLEEEDQGYGREYMSNVDSEVKDYLLDASYIKDETEKEIEAFNLAAIDEFSDAIVSQKNTVVGVINTLKRKDYEGALDKIASGDLVDKKLTTFADTYSKEIDIDAINELFEE